MKHIPGILSYGFEFNQMRVRGKSELEILKKLKSEDAVKDAIPRVKEGDKKPPAQVKPICLLMGYMHQLLEAKDLEDEGIAKDLE
jgi:hypothetical protein